MTNTQEAMKQALDGKFLEWLQTNKTRMQHGQWSEEDCMEAAWGAGVRAALAASQPEPKAGEPIKGYLHLKPPFEDENGNDISGEYITLQAHREAMASFQEANASYAKRETWWNDKMFELEQALAKKDAALDACVEALERVEPQFGYGFYRPENPHDFHPDPESCSPEEITNHKAACEAYDAGTYSPDNSDGWVTPDLHITKAPWGIGSYEVRDPLIDAAIAQAKKARGV